MDCPQANNKPLEIREAIPQPSALEPGSKSHKSSPSDSLTDSRYSKSSNTDSNNSSSSSSSASQHSSNTSASSPTNDSDRNDDAQQSIDNDRGSEVSERTNQVNIVPPSPLKGYVLFGVRGADRFHSAKTRLAQIDVEEVKDDDSFFNEMRKQYQLLRGFLRRCFSIWVFNTCHFVVVRLPFQHQKLQNSLDY